MAEKRNKKPDKKPATEKNIREILGKVRPYIKMHGGDVDLLGVKDGIVTLTISGACSHCSLADLTYNNLIAGLLHSEVSGIKDILIEK